MLKSLSHFLRQASRWLFWPGVMLIAWGELRPQPPPIAEYFWDKAAHFTAYFGLAAMATMVLEPGRRLLWAILGIVLLGGALEILQYFTGRDAEMLDMLANTLGALCGFCVAAILLTLVARQGGD